MKKYKELNVPEFNDGNVPSVIFCDLVNETKTCPDGVVNCHKCLFHSSNRAVFAQWLQQRNAAGELLLALEIMLADYKVATIGLKTNRHAKLVITGAETAIAEADKDKPK